MGEIGPDRYIQLKTREAELEARAREVEQQRQHIATLLQQRAQELTTLRTVRRRQYETRCQKTQELTVALQRNVRVTLWPEGHRQVYKDYLKELFAGLNVREPQRSRWLRSTRHNSNARHKDLSKSVGRSVILS